MPSPFPGMDPYLESPTFWRGLHELFISAMTAQLNQSLPEGYVANLDERLYVVWEERPVYPDLALLRTSPVRSDAKSSSGTAMLDVPPAMLDEDEAQEVTIFSDEQRESYIEILQLGNESADERLVALIEVLSPANKNSGRGRSEYLRKQESILSSPAHLLEIDLLRSGRHTVALPEETIRQRHADTLPDYLICLHPAGNQWFFRYWLRTIRERLPRLHLPLDADGRFVLLDLQAAFIAPTTTVPTAASIIASKPNQPFLPLKLPERTVGYAYEVSAGDMRRLFTSPKGNMPTHCRANL